MSTAGQRAKGAEGREGSWDGAVGAESAGNEHSAGQEQVRRVPSGLRKEGAF